MISRLLGRKKEDQAARWLERQGVEIVARNFTCRGGELDIVGRKGNTLICFEVRHRSRRDRGSAAESLTPAKLTRLQRCFEHFLQRHPQLRELTPRIDALLFDGETATPQWLENITGW